MADAVPFDPTTFDPHAPAFLASPWDTYAQFRAQAPVAPVKVYGAYWVFRYEDVEHVLTDTAGFVKNAPGAPPKPRPGPIGIMSAFPQGLFMADPPRHDKLRAVLEPALRAAMVEAPSVVASFAEPIVAKARLSGRMELLADYALPVPSNTVFTILGIPNDEAGLVWPGLVAWQDAIARAHDVTQSLAVRGAGVTCAMALRTYLTGLIRRCVEDPGSATGMLAEVCPQIDGSSLTVEDVAASYQDLIVAGYLSTTWLIASGMRQLLSNPDQLALLSADAGLIDGAVEEVLRYDDPVQVVDRVVAADVSLGGVALRAGDRLGLVVGSADHDPEVFPEPESFDIAREGAGRMGFGAGIHTCIGAPLVRLMAPVALQTLLTGLPSLAINGLAQWQTDPYLRGMVNLPLRVG
jgi:cytochrome P450